MDKSIEIYMRILFNDVFPDRSVYPGSALVQTGTLQIQVLGSIAVPTKQSLHHILKQPPYHSFEIHPLQKQNEDDLDGTLRVS